MSIDDFCYKWDIQKDNLYTGRHQGAFYTVMNSNAKQVDENYFIRRRDFCNKVKLFNQDMYFYLEEHFSISDIARSIVANYPDVSETGVRECLRVQIFTNDERLIISNKIPKLEWVIFRYFRRVLRQLTKALGFKVDINIINKVLDKRMDIAI